MQKELQDGRAALMNERLECVDLLEPLSHHVIRYPPMDVGNQHVLVMRAVEDADLALGRCLLMHAPEEIMPQFLRRGALKDTTLQPCGFTPDITLLIVPSLPLVSIPCNTMSTGRLPLA